MLKIVVSLSLLCFVCADQQSNAKTDPPKQFRYVEEEEPHHYQSPQKQQSDNYRYESPRHPVNDDQEHLAYNRPEVIVHHEYGANDKQTQDRPLVSVNTDKTGLGKNVDVGVNVGRIYQMDLKRENNFGSKALNLGLSVLGGLVKVNVQRERDPFSGRRGPILVQVGGHTVYSN